MGRVKRSVGEATVMLDSPPGVKDTKDSRQDWDWDLRAFSQKNRRYKIYILLCL